LEKELQGVKIIHAAQLRARKYFDEIGAGLYRRYNFTGRHYSGYHGDARLDGELDDFRIQSRTGNEFGPGR